MEIEETETMTRTTEDQDMQNQDDRGGAWGSQRGQTWSLLGEVTSGLNEKKKKVRTYLALEAHSLLKAPGMMG